MKLDTLALTSKENGGHPMPSGACHVHTHGLDLVLLPGRALWWPQAQMLFVADLHFGKASTFRRAGMPVPGGTTQDNLQRLSALLSDTQAQHLVFLGDLLHARSGADAALWSALAQWRHLHADTALTLVRGNHDWHAGDPPASLGIAFVDEPWQPVEGTALFGCHHPQNVPGALALAGHLHPTAQLFGSGRDRLRVPCFVLQGGQLVLPAFGAFTGTAPTRWPADARLFAVGGERVMALPPGRG